MSPFVSSLSAIAQAHDPTLIGSVALRKDSQRFCLHRSDRCLALMLTCRTLACRNFVRAVIIIIIKFHCTHHSRCKKRFTYIKGII